MWRAGGPSHGPLTGVSWSSSSEGDGQRRRRGVRSCVATARVLFSTGRDAFTQTLHFSPDGNWLLYQSNDAGTGEIYVRSYPALGAPRRVSSGGGHSGHWSADGRTIVYEAPRGTVMSVAVGPAEGLSLGTPEVALEADEFAGLFGVSADGQRFLRRHLPPEALLPEIRVVTGWMEGLGERSSGG